MKQVLGLKRRKVRLTGSGYYYKLKEKVAQMNELTNEVKHTIDDNVDSTVESGLSEMDRERPACVHNFSGDAIEQWRLTCFATGVECKPGAEIVDQVFGLKYWFVHEIELSNDRGQLNKALRTVLIDASGNAYGFVSSGIYKALQLMVSHLGRESFDPPLPIIVRSRKNAGGRKYYSIEPANEQYANEE